MAAPCADVPLPGGRPLPSGPMLMSHRARSASLTGLPSPGRSAATAAPPSISARGMTTARCLPVDMLELPFVIGGPAGDDVHVSHRESGHRNVDFWLAALGAHLGAGPLHVAGLVPGAALQDDRLAVPAAGHAGPGEGLGLHRRRARF